MNRDEQLNGMKIVNWFSRIFNPKYCCQFKTLLLSHMLSSWSEIHLKCKNIHGLQKESVLKFHTKYCQFKKNLGQKYAWNVRTFISYWRNLFFPKSSSTIKWCLCAHYFVSLMMYVTRYRKIIFLELVIKSYDMNSVSRDQGR